MANVNPPSNKRTPSLSQASPHQPSSNKVATPNTSIDEQIQKGPCVLCGDTDYPLSFGGPNVCPACDCQSPQQRLKQLAAENKVLKAQIKELLK